MERHSGITPSKFSCDSGIMEAPELEEDKETDAGC